MLLLIVGGLPFSFVRLVLIAPSGLIAIFLFSRSPIHLQFLFPPAPCFLPLSEFLFSDFLFFVSSFQLCLVPLGQNPEFLFSDFDFFFPLLPFPSFPLSEFLFSVWSSFVFPFSSWLCPNTELLFSDSLFFSFLAFLSLSIFSFLVFPFCSFPSRCPSVFFYRVHVRNKIF